MTTQAIIPEQSNYSIVKELNRSTFSVFLAQDIKTNSYCALKVFPYKNTMVSPSFTKEIQAFNLRHPNIISYIDYSRTNQRIKTNQIRGFTSFIAMELAPYGDFTEFMMSGRMPRDDIFIRTLFQYICKGVKHMHDNNYAHLDLKLENVLISENFMPKVCDFDSIVEVKEGMKKTIFSMGTMNYRAPEVIDSNCKDAFAADIYSLGTILLTLQFGCLPYLEDRRYNGFNLREMLIEGNEEYFRVHAGSSNLPSEFQESFKELAFGMTTKDPNNRLSFLDMVSNEWFSGPVYNDSEFSEIMQKCFA